MNWNKHSKGSEKVRRVAVNVNENLQAAMDFFKENEEGEYTDQAVLQTMIEAGFTLYAEEIQKRRAQANQDGE